MTAKSVLVRPQGLRAGARAPCYQPPCYATGWKKTILQLSQKIFESWINYAEAVYRIM